MLSMLKRWISSRFSGQTIGDRRSRPAPRTHLKVEVLEARENPSAFVPGTAEHAPPNVMYGNSGAFFSTSGNEYYMSNGNVWDYSTSTGWNYLFSNVKEFAVAPLRQFGGDDVVVALQNDGTLQWGVMIPGSTPSYSHWGSDSGVASFQLGGDGAIAEAHANGFFVDWTGPNHTGFGATPSMMLGSVAKYEVAPNNTLYTLQYTGNANGFDYGNLIAWNAPYGSPNLLGSYANNFAVDSYSNIVEVNPVDQVFVDGRLQGSDGLGAAINNYSNDGTFKWQLGYDIAGNLTWHQPYSWNLYT